MGSAAHVIVVGDRNEELADLAAVRVAQLERRWSRFRPGSEIDRLNAANGAPVIVSSDTFALIELAVEAWEATGHRFDPTVMASMNANGYDRSHEFVVDADLRTDRPQDPVVAPGCGDIGLDPDTRSVMLPPHVGLDLGGVGKGRAADLVVDELMAAGSRGVCVNLGGDARVGGEAPGDDGWVVGIEDPFVPGSTLSTVALLHGAVVTSARTRRRWTMNGRPRHHLVDPSSGVPADTGIAAVSVIGADAALTEVWAKAALIAGPVAGVGMLSDLGVSALITSDDGVRTSFGAWESYER